MNKAKILVLGPCESGKTVIANFLSDATETSGGEYHPTQGCRILEFEANNVDVGGKQVTAEVEMWDVSGDHKFENGWPAIVRETSGVIFVYNPDQPNHDKELESWFSYFVENQGVKDHQCTIFAHHKSAENDNNKGNIPASMKKIPLVHTNIEEQGEALRDEFTNYLGNLLTSLSDKREQEELSIMNIK